MAYLTDQARAEDDRHGTGAPLEYIILKMAERWHMHPAAIDPRGQRPNEGKWFWWALETMELEQRFSRST